MAMVSGGQLVARMLKAEGVRHIFTLSGLHVAPIYAGCVEEGIQVIDTRHEQAAAHAADAYARITRGVGVAVVTAGPGVTDALTGVANAHAASSPLLLLGGAAPIFNQSRGSLQEMEQVDLFHRISKWSDRVPTPELVPAYLAKAFRVALSGRPGPVFLELAWDVLCNAVDEESTPLPRRYRTDARLPPDPRKVDEAMALLAAAERPAVIAGSSVYWDEAWEPLRAFCERAQLPVFLNGAGRGCMPPDHPLFFQHTRKEALSGADLVFVIGTPFDFRLNYGAEPTFGAASRIVQVDVDPVEVGRNRAVDVGIVADSRSALEAFARAAPATSREPFLAALRQSERKRAQALEEWTRSDSVPIHHYRLARELSVVANAAGQDPVFVADGGNWVAMAAKVIELRRPGRWLDPGPLGCLGVGAPFAIASKVLHPERTCWVVQGDGSFGLNGMDFDTALRFMLPMVCVVGNDAAWGQIRIPQVGMFGEEKSPGTLLAPTRYDRVVEALGGHGEHVTEPAQIRPALERALASGTVACVNVALDPEAPVKAGAMGYAV
ncbi:thiamine pyrophosphate-binding protein [Aggregicoccus sp. 17bor-14]|uniref:thiamine pyrophosphate-binding protein n=1 Tax=Myxococcaceae TaxID=31 RepID=UPI00129C682F|nr:MULTISPECIES: thiamine pyrophosphate-binding protein [Myxococcaceae]MBF5041284.1 thiamine pyrophosphate-binding protein [Simulacricoccus sp. 17bor-14]MRI87070.1 thiamine pyrophosphate-binding protein [Aggregicoccus sp. 17bor-14]